jgi:hypothetical protein
LFISQAKYRTLPSALLGQKAALWWPRMSLSVAQHISEAIGELDPSATPANYLEIVNGLKPVRISNAEACDAATRGLIEEAKACQKRTISPGAIIEVQFGPFERFQFWQYGHEIAIVGWNHADEFTLGGFSLSNSAIRLPIPCLGAENEIEDAEAALTLLLASVIRDFLVVKQPESIWSAKKNRRAPGISRPFPRSKLTTYRARRRYRSVDRARSVGYLNETLDLSYRVEHSLHAHIRKVGREAFTGIAAPAEHHGLTIKAGHAFAPSRARGSRMAGWLKFERDVRALVLARGLEIEQLNAHWSGDGVIDVYAWNPSTGATFVVHAKCSRKRVGPAVVREFAECLKRYPAGTAGIIVTTGRFIDGAIDEARTRGIELIDRINLLKEST